MEKQEKKPIEFFKKNVLTNGNKLLDSVKNFSTQVTSEDNINKTITTMEKSAQSGVNKIKTNPQLQSLKTESLKIKKKGIKQGKLLKKQSPKFFVKIKLGFFYFFEALVGRIKLGTQYGVSSLELLEKLAKLKELGILTEKEFQLKKTEILKRI